MRVPRREERATKERLRKFRDRVLELRRDGYTKDEATVTAFFEIAGHDHRPNGAEIRAAAEARVKEGN